MRLQEMREQGFEVRSWMLATVRKQRYVVIKLRRNERRYVAHSPIAGPVTALSGVEFTEPVHVS